MISVSVRTNYHRQLLLPLDKPLLRDGNKIIFDPLSPSLPSSSSNPLENDCMSLFDYQFNHCSIYWPLLDRLKDVHLQLQLDEGKIYCSTKLLNIYLFSHCTGTSTGGAKFLVKGSYLYYHYQQVYSTLSPCCLLLY